MFSRKILIGLLFLFIPQVLLSDSIPEGTRLISDGVGIVHVVGNDYAFAALKGDGTVVTWGDAAKGGNSKAVASMLTGVTHIVATQASFAALKGDGSVVSWGHIMNHGTNDPLKGHQMVSKGVVKLYSNEHAFVALKANGSVVTWGDSRRGGSVGERMREC